MTPNMIPIHTIICIYHKSTRSPCEPHLELLDHFRVIYTHIYLPSEIGGQNLFGEPDQCLKRLLLLFC